MWPFLLLVGVPLAELLLLIEVGGRIGPLATVLICIGTGVLGAQLARSQGSSVLARMRDEVNRGRVPARELVDGVLILVAAALLLTPGYITDVVGMALLLPPTRALVRPGLVRWARSRITTNVRTGGFSGLGGRGPFDGPHPFDRRGPFDPPPRRPPPTAAAGEQGAEQEIIPPEEAGPVKARKRPRVITIED
jgi:UPF0716 protein FxsA